MCKISFCTCSSDRFRIANCLAPIRHTVAFFCLLSAHRRHSYRKAVIGSTRIARRAGI